jgi:hypothetical protein
MSSVAKNAKVREILGTFWDRVEGRGDLYSGVLDGGFFFLRIEQYARRTLSVLYHYISRSPSARRLQ